MNCDELRDDQWERLKALLTFPRFRGHRIKRRDVLLVRG